MSSVTFLLPYSVAAGVLFANFHVIIRSVLALVLRQQTPCTVEDGIEQENLIDLRTVETLCPSCHYDETNQPTTTAATRRSGQVCRNITRLRTAAQTGCWLCQALLSSMTLWKSVDTEKYESLVLVWIRFDKERFTVVGPNDLPRIQIYFPKGKPSISRLIADTEIPLTASSPKTLDFVKNQLETCIQGHSACRDYQSQLKRGVNDQWPQRVLKIETRSVRLVHFDTSMQRNYVALSYCWGPQDGKLVATKMNLPLLEKGVAISDLPATLMDAVNTTLKLGSSFIWIDALCIIQDDPADWSREAGKMSTVYAQALITIIASSAVSCEEGFLGHERHQSIEVGRVRIGDQVIDLRARLIYDWGHHRGGPQAADYSYKRWFDPVDGRGWTLQERLLSGRYVNFTTGEAQWGCLMTRSCECGQEFYGDLYKKSQSLEEEWFATVEEFTTRKLTVQTDRLTALAGIARRTSLSLPWKWYAAGIWLSPDHMELSMKGLLWRRLPGTPVPTFSHDYIAPSFSWASIAGEIVHLDKPRVAFPSTIIAFEAQTCAGDDFGAIEAAVLKISGPYIAAKLRWRQIDVNDSQGVWIKIEGEKRFKRGAELDGPLEAAMTAPGKSTVRRKTSKSKILTFTSDTNEPDEGDDVILLPLAVRELAPQDSSVKYYPEPTRLYYIECIVLVRSLRFDGFERIGLYSWTQDKVTLDVPCRDICIY